MRLCCLDCTWKALCRACTSTTALQESSILDPSAQTLCLFSPYRNCWLQANLLLKKQRRCNKKLFRIQLARMSLSCIHWYSPGYFDNETVVLPVSMSWLIPIPLALTEPFDPLNPYFGSSFNTPFSRTFVIHNFFYPFNDHISSIPITSILRAC